MYRAQLTVLDLRIAWSTLLARIVAYEHNVSHPDDVSGSQKCWREVSCQPRVQTTHGLDSCLWQGLISPASSFGSPPHLHTKVSPQEVLQVPYLASFLRVVQPHSRCNHTTRGGTGAQTPSRLERLRDQMPESGNSDTTVKFGTMHMPQRRQAHQSRAVGER